MINIDLRKDGASSSKLMMVSKNNENYNQSEVDSFSNLRQMRLPPVQNKPADLDNKMYSHPDSPMQFPILSPSNNTYEFASKQFPAKRSSRIANRTSTNLASFKSKIHGEY